MASGLSVRVNSCGLMVTHGTHVFFAVGSGVIYEVICKGDSGPVPRPPPPSDLPDPGHPGRPK